MPRLGADLIRRTSETDNYSTPVEAVYPLLWKERERILNLDSFYEPCSGEGNIVKAFIDYLGPVFPSFIFSSDIRGGVITQVSRINPMVTDHWDWHDFVNDVSPFEDRGADCIITNPPFSIAEDVAKRALILTRKRVGMVALLLRIQFLEGLKRTEWLKKTLFRTIYVFQDRVSMYPEGHQPEKRTTGTQCFAWFVWDWRFDPLEKPQIEWIKTMTLEEVRK